MIGRHCYQQAMSDRLRPGVPDCWYSGIKGDLWVEYKFQPALRVVTPALTELQKAWLNGRYEEGRNVAVVVALTLREALWLRDGVWNHQCNTIDAVPVQQIVNNILKEVGTNERTNGFSDGQTTR
jgi:hypothetical protein